MARDETKFENWLRYHQKYRYIEPQKYRYWKTADADINEPSNWKYRKLNKILLQLTLTCTRLQKYYVW